MQSTDPIADMLTAIRNAAMTRKEKTISPYSKIKEEILKVLKREGYISEYKIVNLDSENKKKNIVIYLKYGPHGEKIINNIKRISKPGRRIFRRIEKFGKVLDGLGISIVSTNKGILSDRECKKLKLGGEIICNVW